MIKYYNDFKEDGNINSEKFKDYDPFLESPDTVTHIGTAIVSLKPLSYLLSVQYDYKLVDYRLQKAGTVNIELIPCDPMGNVLTKKDKAKSLKNDSVNFIIEINSANLINPIFEVNNFSKLFLVL
jgi:hypothetical protein